VFGADKVGNGHLLPPIFPLSSALMNDETRRRDASTKLVELHPDLERVVQEYGLDKTKLRAGLPTIESGKVPILERNFVVVSDDKKAAQWEVPSLRALFRGDKVPPSFPSGPTPEYMPLFYFIEQHAVLFCNTDGNKSDAEFEEAYGYLRRRPDGKSLSQLQSFLWQTAAVLAGKRPLSAAEFDAIFGRLAQSASTFRMGLISRNYIQTLRAMSGS
jgi:hypothetical protein